MTIFLPSARASPAEKVWEVILAQFVTGGGHQVEVSLHDRDGVTVQVDDRVIMDLPIRLHVGMVNVMKILIGADPVYATKPLSGDFDFSHQGHLHPFLVAMRDQPALITVRHALKGPSHARPHPG